MRSIDSNACKFKEEQGCKGCKELKGKIFWGGMPAVSVHAKKEQEHCGKRNQFPCEKLKEFTASENPERIDNLGKIIN